MRSRGLPSQMNPGSSNMAHPLLLHDCNAAVRAAFLREILKIHDRAGSPAAEKAPAGMSPGTAKQLESGPAAHGKEKGICSRSKKDLLA